MTGSQVSIMNLLGNTTNSGCQNPRHGRRLNGSLGKGRGGMGPFRKDRPMKTVLPKPAAANSRKTLLTYVRQFQTPLFRLSGDKIWSNCGVATTTSPPPSSRGKRGPDLRPQAIPGFFRFGGHHLVLHSKRFDPPFGDSSAEPSENLKNSLKFSTFFADI